MQKLKYIILSVCLPLLVVSSSWKSPSVTGTSAEKESTINWITWEEAARIVEEGNNSKKIFVDVYTDWCGWCKVMDKQTFNHPEVAKYMNENYLMVKFNAEQKEDINYKGQVLKFIPNGRRGFHELAYALLNKRLSYPTVVFLAEDMSMLSPVPGFLKPDLFYTIANYYGSDSFKETPWSEYEETFKVPFVSKVDARGRSIN